MSRLYFIICFVCTVYFVTSTDRCVYLQSGDAMYHEQIDCNKTKICNNKIFDIVSLIIPPYSDKSLLVNIIRLCCGSCPGFKIRTTTVAYTKQTINKTMNTIRRIGDFVYPFLGELQTTSLYGRYFVPVVPVPSLFYVTRNEANILADLVLNSLKLYPLVIICITLAIISGFIIWSLETWFNEEEFPRNFLNGWFEGFWWAFISMTTVGYGDKTPKKLVARCFSVIWIIMGIALFNIVTGEITTILVQANNPPPPTVRGNRIGVLKYREYDKSYVTKNGGLVYHTEESSDKGKNNFYEEIHQLIVLLRNKALDGIVLDKSTMSYLLNYLRTADFSSDPVKKENSVFMVNKTLRTEKSFDSGDMAYGILVKHKTHYDFFGSAIKDNRISLMSDKELEWNRGDVSSSDSEHLFDPKSRYFVNGISAIAGIIGCIIIFGIFFEFKRKRKSADSAIKQNVKYELNQVQT